MNLGNVKWIKLIVKFMLMTFAQREKTQSEYHLVEM